MTADRLTSKDVAWLKRRLKHAAKMTRIERGQYATWLIANSGGLSNVVGKSVGKHIGKHSDHL